MEDNYFTLLCLDSAIQQCESAISINIYIYIYIYILFLLNFSTTIPTPSYPSKLSEHWVELPVLYRNFPLAISFTCGNVYVPMLLSIHPTLSLPTMSKVCSLCLHLYSCPENRVISIIFLDSIYIYTYIYVNT